MTKILQTNEVMALGETEISRSAILTLQQEYRYCFGRSPDILRMAPDAHKSIFQQLDPHDLPNNPTLIFGMVPEADFKLRDGEWMVGRKETLITVR